MDLSEADKRKSRDAFTAIASPGVAPVDDMAAPQVAGLRRVPLAPAALAFVDWAAGLAGREIVLDRHRFEPEDLKSWLGALSILQWDDGASDYCYRLFGSNWTDTLGRDLTARPVAAWPDKMARAIRDRVHHVVATGRPVGAHVAVALAIGGRVQRGHTVFEQIVWPLSYGPGALPAVIALAVPVP